MFYLDAVIVRSDVIFFFSTIDLASANSETQFVEHAVQQLLKARKVLKCSYVYGYYLDGPGYMKIVFEFMQVQKEIC